MDYAKKIIEVAIPLEAINRGCEQDKNRKTGHIRNLHKWFAPMPLPSWRALIFASLIDDPGEHLPPEDAAIERVRLQRIIEGLSSFSAHCDQSILSQARAELNKALGDAKPVVVDPFCGGGSTILEAQRLGLPTRASDLNPLPVLITTLLCRVAPMFSGKSPVSPSTSRDQDLICGWAGLRGFVADIEHYAQVIRGRAWGVLKDCYPPSSDGQGVPFAYRWAWTVASPDPAAQGSSTPLVTDWRLSKHRRAPAWIVPAVQDGHLTYSVETNGTAPEGTTGKQYARCLISGAPIPVEYIRSEGRAGRLRQSMIAVASRRGGEVVYSPPDAEQLSAAQSVPQVDMAGIEMPSAALGFRVQQYGMSNFLDLFTPRQAYSLCTFADAVAGLHGEVHAAASVAGLGGDDISLEEGGAGARAYADAVCAFLAICVSKMAQSNCVLVRWFIDPRNGSGKATPAFDRQVVPMVWDFVETNPFGGSVGDWTGPVLQTALRALELCATESIPASVSQLDARQVASSVAGGNFVATDPPYYDNIGYADLSDFFYVWLRRALIGSFPYLFATLSAPKHGELISSVHRHEGVKEAADGYFRSGFAEVFGSLVKKSDTRFPMLIVYAIKQDEGGTGAATGWELFLEGLIEAGVSVVATWPVRTTTKTRMRGIESNALASAIFVVGRPRLASAVIVSRQEFIRELKSELPQAMIQLQKCNIAPVDLQQAAIGPGMGVFTRYSKVEDATGKTLTVREALTLINQTLDEVLAEQEGDFDSDTRWALAWFDQFGFAEGEFGVAETLSKAKNTSVNGMVEAGVAVSGAGKVRLLKPAELPADWDPARDTRLTVWEMVHHLIRALDQGGELAAAALVAKLGSQAETARELAYRLYSVCERKKRAVEALAYNGLVQSWPELVNLAREDVSTVQAQPNLFDDEEELV